jgi:hypothetical protein
MSLSRENFEQLCQPLLDRALSLIQRVLTSATLALNPGGGKGILEDTVCNFLVSQGIAAVILNTTGKQCDCEFRLILNNHTMRDIIIIVL